MNYLSKSHLMKFRVNLEKRDKYVKYRGGAWNCLIMYNQLKAIDGKRHLGKHFLSALLF